MPLSPPRDQGPAPFQLARAGVVLGHGDRLGVHLRLDAGLARLVLGRTSLLLSVWIGDRHVTFPS